MKKVLSIVLSLSMVLGSFGLAFAATPNVASKFSDVNGKNCEEAVKVLSDLSVVTGYDDGTYKPENIVTRAEMAVLVVNALGLQNYVTTTAKSTFKDMANYGWAEGYISYAQQLGIISGYGDGTFKPGKTVSYDEAATMLVAALGYTPVSLQGTWPANYVTKAKSLGILDDVKAGVDGANRGDTAIMLYQTLDQKIGIVNKDNVWKETEGQQIPVPGYKDKQNAGDKMIYRLGADPKDTEIDTVVTGDESSLINLRPYVGMCATEYKKDGKVIAITDIQSTFIPGSIDGSSKDKDGNLQTINSFSGDDDVDYTFNLADTTDDNHDYASWNQVKYFYNGKPLSTQKMHDKLSKLEFSVKTLAPTLADDQDAVLAVKDNGKTIKTLYSISVWDHIGGQGTDAKVTDSDLNAIKNDKSLLGEDFETLKDGSIDLNSFELIGVASLDKIAKDNVVFVYTDDANPAKITRVEVSQDTVSGEITKVNLDENKFTIDGKNYKFSENKDFKGQYGVGDTIKAYLDPKGKIYAIDDVSSTAGNYAVVLVAPVKNGDSDLANYEVKLFTKDGNTSTLTFKDDAAWEKGDTYTKIQPGDLVTYDLNSAGKITKLTQQTVGAKDGNTRRIPLKGSVNNGVVNGMQLADNAVIFTVDGKAGQAVKDLEFDVTNVKNIDKDSNIKPSGSPAIAGQYALSHEGGKVKALIIAQSASGATNSYGFVTSVSSEKNKKGDSVKKIEALINGKEVKAQTDSNNPYDAVIGTNLLNEKLLRFDFNGDVITGIHEMNNFLEYTNPSFDSDKITKNQAAIYDEGKWQQVYDTADNAVDIHHPSTDTEKVDDKTPANFVTVKGAKAYQAKITNSGALDTWQLGNVSNINRGDYVVLFQVNKNDSAPDVVVYVTKNDVRKLDTTKFNFNTKAINPGDGSNIAWNFADADSGSKGQKQTTVTNISADNNITATTTASALDTKDGIQVNVKLTGTADTQKSINYTLSTGDPQDRIETVTVDSESPNAPNTVDKVDTPSDLNGSTYGSKSVMVTTKATTALTSGKSQTIIFTIRHAGKTDYNLKLTAKTPASHSIALAGDLTAGISVNGSILTVTGALGSSNVLEGALAELTLTQGGTAVIAAQGFYSVTVKADKVNGQSVIANVSPITFQVGSDGNITFDPSTRKVTFEAKDNVVDLTLDITKIQSPIGFKETQFSTKDNQGGTVIVDITSSNPQLVDFTGDAVQNDFTYTVNADNGVVSYTLSLDKASTDKGAKLINSGQVTASTGSDGKATGTLTVQVPKGGLSDLVLTVTATK